jgi:UDP-N-acetylmuramyl tripeptide synthase
MTRQALTTVFCSECGDELDRYSERKDAVCYDCKKQRDRERHRRKSSAQSKK